MLFSFCSESSFCLSVPHSLQHVTQGRTICCKYLTFFFFKYVCGWDANVAFSSKSFLAHPFSQEDNWVPREGGFDIRTFPEKHL